MIYSFLYFFFLLHKAVIICCISNGTAIRLQMTLSIKYLLWLLMRPAKLHYLQLTVTLKYVKLVKINRFIEATRCLVCFNLKNIHKMANIGKSHSYYDLNCVWGSGENNFFSTSQNGILLVCLVYSCCELIQSYFSNPLVHFLLTCHIIY